MKALLEAFTIFAKYIPNMEYPTICQHDELLVLCDPELVSEEDMKKLSELGFDPANLDTGEACFRSWRYGSA